MHAVINMYKGAVAGSSVSRTPQLITLTVISRPFKCFIVIQCPNIIDESIGSCTVKSLSTMSDVDRPLGNKRALLIAVRHVKASRFVKEGELSNLKLSHRYARELGERLISDHGYHREDIILMMDDSNLQKHLWPTYKNILDQIDNLIKDAPEGCHFFFSYSGHCLEEECHHDAESERASGQDDEIFSADGKPIIDHIIHDRLITPLEKLKDSKLFALLDCCHSETLLDLHRGEGPNRYSRKWNKFSCDQLFKPLVHVIVTFLRSSKKHCPNVDVIQPVPRQINNPPRLPASTTKQVGELSVICLSACRDREQAHDDVKGELTFTKCFLDATAGRPNMTWDELRGVLKDLVADIRRRYEEYQHEAGIEHPESWTQEPRYDTTPHTDLTGRVEF